MGMYDEIKVEVILPGNTEVVDTWFQTKDLDSVLDKYIITKNGELYREHWDYQWIDDENEMLKGYLEKIEGSYRREYLTDFHGDLNFCGMINDNSLRDYYARFTEGKLTKLWYEDKQY